MNGAPLSGKNKSFEAMMMDNESYTYSPRFKPVPKHLLPRYTAVLSGETEDGVGMINIDQLQHELEKLLSSCAVRVRSFKSELESLDRSEDGRKGKKGKQYDKQIPAKRKKIDEKCSKYNIKSDILLKPKHGASPNTYVSHLPMKSEMPKVVFPKNDLADKFWMSVQPYCCDLSADDMDFLDKVIETCSQEFDVKIPEIGDHYAFQWPDDVVVKERTLTNLQRAAKPKSMNFNFLKKNGVNAMVDTFSSPLSERLLAALIEEKVMTNFNIPATIDRKASDFQFSKPPKGLRNGNCMDKRLIKELVEVGIFDEEDLAKPPEDDILIEIKKCMQELSAVNEKNLTELSKLRAIISTGMERQKVKEKLDKVETEVMDVYNKILVTGQKQNRQCDEPGPHEYDKEATMLMQEQMVLQEGLSDLSKAITQF